MGIEVYITPDISLLDSLWSIFTIVFHKFEAILLIACMSAENNLIMNLLHVLFSFLLSNYLGYIGFLLHAVA